MTTLNSTIQRFVGQVHQNKLLSNVPQELVRETKAIFFAKCLPHGRLRSKKHAGFYVRLLPDGKFSVPVAVEIVNGAISCRDAFDNVDLLLLINDIEAVEALEGLEQVAFNGKFGRREVVGPVRGKFDANSFERAKTRDPGFLTHSTFSFHVGRGQLFPAKFRDAVLHFKTSSNVKFYNSKNATMINLRKLQNARQEDEENLGFKSLREAFLGNVKSRETVAQLHRILLLVFSSVIKEELEMQCMKKETAPGLERQPILDQTALSEELPKMQRASSFVF